MYSGKTAAPMRCGALVSAYKIQQMIFFYNGQTAIKIQYGVSTLSLFSKNENLLFHSDFENS